MISYLPINRMRDMTLPVIQQLAQETGRTPAQVVLRWHVQHQQLPIPKSSHEERIRENIQIFDFELSDAEMAALDALETGIRSGFSRDVYPPGS